MSTTNNPGIDYSAGTANRNASTGIHYGVIPAHDLGQSWYDGAEANYGEPHCPKCGNEAKHGSPEDDEGYECSPHACGDYHCPDCQYMFDGEQAFGDSPLSWYIDDGEYLAEQSGDCDIFVVRSPYYTRAQFCSPCAPGAAYLRNPCPDGPKAYCFGPDWFDGDSPCPYPVYSVADDSLVYSPPAE